MANRGNHEPKTRKPAGEPVGLRFQPGESLADPTLVCLFVSVGSFAGVCVVRQFIGEWRWRRYKWRATRCRSIANSLRLSKRKRTRFGENGGEIDEPIQVLLRIRFVSCNVVGSFFISRKCRSMFRVLLGLYSVILVLGVYLILPSYFRVLLVLLGVLQGFTWVLRRCNRLY